ncbi:MAG: SDR family oxidoreductase [Anaerolineae bacterium]|nr:SDR family oxidoreductase [Anaerolineae bacterium]
MENNNKKTALITGATSGIGAEFARYLAQEGYNLILTGRRESIIRAFAAELEQKFGIQAKVFIVELSDPAGVDALINSVTTEQIDYLINNAGFGDTHLFSEGQISVLEDMVEAHVKAPVKLIHALLPGMIKRKFGRIINVSSEAVFLPMRKNAMYGGTKAFLKSFSESLSMELKDSGVKVQALCPGLTWTDFHEKIGFGKERQKDHGFIHWMKADEVVKISMQDLEKGVVVCLPGFHTRLTVFILNCLPRSLYFRLMTGLG